MLGGESSLPNRVFDGSILVSAHVVDDLHDHQRKVVLRVADQLIREIGRTASVNDRVAGTINSLHVNVQERLSWLAERSPSSR